MGSRLVLNMREAYYRPLSTIDGVSSFRTANFRNHDDDAAPPPDIRLNNLPAQGLWEDTDWTWDTESIRFRENESLEELPGERGRPSKDVLA